MPPETPKGHPRELPANGVWSRFALLLTTGGVGAVGFLPLDGVFSANVTGNVVMPAVGGADVRGVPVTATEVPVVAVAGALLGLLFGVALRAARFLRA